MEPSGPHFIRRDLACAEPAPGERGEVQGAWVQAAWVQVKFYWSQALRDLRQVA